MDAIHINWTKPFRNRFNAPYEVEDFEILTTILSALKWREKNGNIKMVTDSVGAEYYKKTGLDVIWTALKIFLTISMSFGRQAKYLPKGTKRTYCND